MKCITFLTLILSFNLFATTTGNFNYENVQLQSDGKCKVTIDGVATTGNYKDSPCEELYPTNKPSPSSTAIPVDNNANNKVK